MTPARGQDREQVARDQWECEEEARRATDSRVIEAALATKLQWAVGGALLGALIGAAGMCSDNGTCRDTRDSALAIGLLAGLGAAVGIIVGTVKSVEVGVAEAREERERLREAYARCMEDRGYTVGPAARAR